MSWKEKSYSVCVAGRKLFAQHVNNLKITAIDDDHEWVVSISSELVPPVVLEVFCRWRFNVIYLTASSYQTLRTQFWFNIHFNFLQKANEAKLRRIINIQVKQQTRDKYRLQGTRIKKTPRASVIGGTILFWVTIVSPVNKLWQLGQPLLFMVILFIEAQVIAKSRVRTKQKGKLIKTTLLY